MRGVAAIALATLASLSLPSAGSAHLGHVVLRAERYLKLDAHERRLRVVVSLTLGPEEGQRVLAAADAEGDGDGRVDERERAAYLERWAEGLASELTLRVDGREMPLTFGQGYLDPIGRVRAIPLTAEQVAVVELEGGSTLIELEDGMRQQAFDRTDVAFRARDGARLEASGIGPDEPDSIVRDLYFTPVARGADEEPVILRARYLLPEGPPSPWSTVGWIGALALLALASSILWWVRRRRRA